VLASPAAASSPGERSRFCSTKQHSTARQSKGQHFSTHGQ
jgi:hypothetical protein